MRNKIAKALRKAGVDKKTYKCIPKNERYAYRKENSILTTKERIRLEVLTSLIDKENK